MPQLDSVPHAALHPAVAGVRSTLIGIALNVALAAVKFVAGVMGHSYALIAMPPSRCRMW